MVSYRLELLHVLVCACVMEIKQPARVIYDISHHCLKKTTDLEFISNKLGYLDENSFKNISGLNLTRFSINRRINHIDKPAFLMLPHLQYLDLSGNVGLHFGNLRKAFHGLRNSALREISLRNMRFYSLYKDFFPT